MGATTDKIIASILIIVLVVILVWDFYPIEVDDEPDFPLIGYIEQPTPDGNADVAMTILNYNIAEDTALTEALRDHTDRELDPAYHSVKSFYQKYGMNLNFNYYTYDVSQLNMRDDLCNPDEDYSYCRADGIIYGWARDNPDALNTVYNNNDVLVFVIHTDIPTFTDAGTYVTYDAFEGSESASQIRSGAAAFLIAHEIGHLFGAHDRYWDKPTGCENSLMNEGGGESGYLTKQTDFCNEDTDELHFDWVRKVNNEYLNGG